MKFFLVAIFSIIGILSFATSTAKTVNLPAGPYNQVSPVCASSGVFTRLVPCSRHCDDPSTTENETDACSVCHIIVLGHNIVRYLVFIAVFIAFAVIVFAGVMYVVSAGDESMISAAKSALKYALVGVVILLGAWVIINTLLTVFLPKRDGALLQGSAWKSYYCAKNENVTTGAGGADSNTGGGNSGGADSNTGGADSNTGTNTGTGTTGATGATGDHSDAGSGTTTATGADSHVNSADISAHTGPLYCATTVGQLHVLRDDNNCYTDRTYCKNKFDSTGGGFQLFGEGRPQSIAYDYYTASAKLVVVNVQGIDLANAEIKDAPIPASSNSDNPKDECQKIIKAYRDAASKSPDITAQIDSDCIGGMNMLPS